MDIDGWWHTLDPATREELIASNGEALTPEQVEQITAAGGVVEPDSDGEYLLPDEEVDWIESLANGENPALD